jgi:hypothetical protein
MNEVVTLDKNQYAAMAKAMGMSADTGAKETKASSLARLRINHSAIMGQSEVNGKKVNLEVVEGGTYKLEIADGETLYAKNISIRPFAQRFMYKKFLMGTDKTPNRYVKTVMADNLNIDLKDNDGGFNCGKPAGYIEDFKALPEKMQDLIRLIKRVRVLFGVVEMVDPVNSRGETVSIESTPFIWEIENRDAFKTVGNLFTKLTKLRRLPVQHYMVATTEERKLPNGNSFYLPEVSLDLANSLDMDNDTQETFANFLAWITNYNEYITNTWNEKVHTKEEVDVETVSEFVDISEEEFA